MAIPSFSAFHDEGINLEGLLEILSPENNLVLADDMMVSDGNGIIPVSYTHLTLPTKPIV